MSLRLCTAKVRFLWPVQIRLRRDQPRPGSGILDLSYADSTQANQGETVSAGWVQDIPVHDFELFVKPLGLGEQRSQRCCSSPKKLTRPSLQAAFILVGQRPAAPRLARLKQGLRVTSKMALVSSPISCLKTSKTSCLLRCRDDCPSGNGHTTNGWFATTLEARQWRSSPTRQWCQMLWSEVKKDQSHLGQRGDLQTKGAINILDNSSERTKY